MKKGHILKNIVIEAIGFGWVGIWVAENWKKILIKWSVVPHSTIDCVVIKSKKDHILAMPTRVVSVDQHRADTDPKCPHYTNPLAVVSDDQIHKNGCGWCKRQIVSYPRQLELKAHLVYDSFRHVSYLIDQAPLYPIVPSPLIYQYRNKIEFSFGKYITKASNDIKAKKQKNWELVNELSSWGGTTKEPVQQQNWDVGWLDSSLRSEWQNEAIKNSDFSHYYDRQLGFHRQGYYTHVVDVDQCYLISEKLHTVYAHIKILCQSSGLPVHDPKTHLWVFRHLVMREWCNTNQILINLIISDEQINTPTLIASWEEFQKKLLADTRLREECTTFLITYNNTVSDAVRQQDTRSDILWGQGVIFEELQFGTDSVRFRVSPFSFFQTNTLGAQALFSTVASFIRLPEDKQTIMDLYCGAGTIGLSLLAQGIGDFVLGIEIVEDAIKDAQYNAQMNGVSERSYFVAGKTEQILSHDPTFATKMDTVWLIVVDPPREGLHPDVCFFLNTLKKDYNFQLIYISCNPVTLARDLDLLVQWGRWLDTLQPVDMFPHTHHVEMISVLG